MNKLWTLLQTPSHGDHWYVSQGYMSRSCMSCVTFDMSFCWSQENRDYPSKCSTQYCKISFNCKRPFHCWDLSVVIAYCHLEMIWLVCIHCSPYSSNDPDGTEPTMSGFSSHWDELQPRGLISGNTQKIIFLMAGYLVTAGANTEICPVSHRGLCAVTTLWCWGLSKNSSNTDFAFFFQQGNMQPGAWDLVILTELNQPCWCECRKWLSKPKVSHLFPCTWWTRVAYNSHCLSASLLHNSISTEHQIPTALKTHGKNILNKWSLTRSKWSLCSIPSEGKKCFKVSHFTPSISSSTVDSCLTFSCLAGAGELTEFEIVISGKIMGNPWESCWSRETMQSAPRKSTFSGNAQMLFVFYLFNWAPKQSNRRNKNETLIQQFATYFAMKSWGQLNRKQSYFIFYGVKYTHGHLLIFQEVIHPEQLKQKPTGHVNVTCYAYWWYP